MVSAADVHDAPTIAGEERKTSYGSGISSVLGEIPWIPGASKRRSPPVAKLHFSLPGLRVDGINVAVAAGDDDGAVGHGRRRVDQLRSF